MKTFTMITALVALAAQSFGSPVASDSVSPLQDFQLGWNQEHARSDRAFTSLEKRRGGGGGGGGRGGGGSSSSGSSSGSGSGSGSRGGSGSGSGGSTGGTRSVTSSSSSSPSFGGGQFYGGGSRTAFTPGTRSPSSPNIAPFLIGGAGLGLLAATWPHGAWIYGFNTRYDRHNDTTNQNQTLPVECLCDPYSSCGCGDTNNSTFIDSLFYPNGTSMNETIARIQNVNGTDTVILNGTLANGTESDTGAAFGGSALSSKALVDAALAAGVVAGFMIL